MNMNVETAAMLRDSAQRYAADQYSFLQRKAVLADPAGRSARSWRDYAEFGWLGLRLPAERGGLDADPLTVGALMEVVGSRLLMEPDGECSTVRGPRRALLALRCGDGNGVTTHGGEAQ